MAPRASTCFLPFREDSGGGGETSQEGPPSGLVRTALGVGGPAGGGAGWEAYQVSRGSDLLTFILTLA